MGACRLSTFGSAIRRIGPSRLLGLGLIIVYRPSHNKSRRITVTYRSVIGVRRVRYNYAMACPIITESLQFVYRDLNIQYSDLCVTIRDTSEHYRLIY